MPCWLLESDDDVLDFEDEECLLSPSLSFLLDLSLSLPFSSLLLSRSLLLTDSLLLLADEVLDRDDTGPFSSLHKNPPLSDSVFEGGEDFLSGE